jgi:hypothetical protein
MGFLDAIRVDQETAHTRLLAWLLDPREDHQLGVTFLRRFLKSAVGDARPAVTATTVSLEERQDESRADLTLSTNTRYFLIENKINWAAFQWSQIERHARSGTRRAKRAGQKFHLILVVPDTRRHCEELKKLPRHYRLSTIEWSEIASVARHTAASVRRSASGGRAFLEAYADFIERQILHQWKGFNMAILTDQVVSAAAIYLVSKRALLADIGAFFAAVHEGLDSSVTFEPRQESERYYPDDSGVVLLRNRYDFRGWRTQVALTVYAATEAKSRRSLWLQVAFYCNDQVMEKRVRNRGLRNKTAAVQRFGPKAESRFSDGIWVGEDIPRKLWLTADPKASQSAVAYTQKVLSRYLREAHKLVR